MDDQLSGMNFQLAALTYDDEFVYDEPLSEAEKEQLIFRALDANSKSERAEILNRLSNETYY